MHVLIAPDTFKGSLSAAHVAECLATGLEDDPLIRCSRLPLADGGEGSVAAAVAAGFREHLVEVAGLGHRAQIAFDGTTAVVEVANTCGIALLPSGERHPLTASSLGFGQAVRAALDLEPRTVVLALGGSASTDGGLGLLSALGGTITDAAGQPVPPNGEGLDRVAQVDLANINTRVRWIVAGDVDAVLHGPGGAAHLFGPQKGANPHQVDRLDAGLNQLAGVFGPRGQEAAATPGAGAAGGLGFAALLLGAEMRSGAAFFLDLLGFDQAVERADAVITGEGCIDDQTLLGKLPYVVAQRAVPRPTFAVVGSNEITPGSALNDAFAGIHQLTEVTHAETRHDPIRTAHALTAVGRLLATELRRPNGLR